MKDKFVHHPIQQLTRLVLMMGLLVGFVSLSTQASQASTTTPAANSVIKAIAAAPTLTSLPPNLTPPLTDFANAAEADALSGVASFSACSAYNNTTEQNNPTPCIMGDVQSSKVIVIVGDSYVGNWVPALNKGLSAAGYRLDVFGFPGCPTADIRYTGLGDNESTACNTWHAKVPGVISALHPVAVIVTSGYDMPNVSDKTWVDGFDTLFTKSTAGSPSAKRILMGISPFFTEPVPDCLAGHSNPRDCSISDRSGIYRDYLEVDPIIATASKAKLIPTYQWFCHKQTCSAVISHFVVFADSDHLTIAYSDYISTLVTSAVLNALTT
ncbi:MAG: SGNH hydrolase domain-containing protein, partial [Acidimicrobiales bacterium]